MGGKVCIIFIDEEKDGKTNERFNSKHAEERKAFFCNDKEEEHANEAKGNEKEKGYTTETGSKDAPGNHARNPRPEACPPKG